MQSGLRNCPASAALWLEYFRMVRRPICDLPLLDHHLLVVFDNMRCQMRCCAMLGLAPSLSPIDQYLVGLVCNMVSSCLLVTALVLFAQTSYLFTRACTSGEARLGRCVLIVAAAPSMR